MLVEGPRRLPTQVSVETVRPAQRIGGTSKKQASVSKFRQFLDHPVQQFATDAAILEIRQQRKNYNFPGSARAEAVADKLSRCAAYVAWQRTRADVLCP